MVLLQGMQQTLGSVRVDCPELLHQFLHLLPLGFAVCGAWRRDDRERQRFEHVLHMGLRQVDKRPDHGDPRAAHQRFRMEGMEPSLVEQAHEAWNHDQICELRPPLVADGKLSFVFVNYTAKKVELMGDFNEWTPKQYYFQEMFDGIWKVEIDAPAPGRYRYKFRVDEKDWFEDPANLYRKPNVWGTYDSILNISESEV